jgi:15-cis-phytoene synthase
VDDAAINRVYLPSDWLVDEGIHSISQILQYQKREALGRVASRLVNAADPYYRSAGEGIRALPLRSAWSVATARGVYRNIGHRVKAYGANAWDRRIQTSRISKLWFVAHGAAFALAVQGIPASPRPPSLWTRPR